MNDTTLHLDQSIWNHSIVKGCDSKRRKMAFIREYGLEIESDDTCEMERMLLETHTRFVEHLSELADLIEYLYDRPDWKLSQAKAQLKLLTHIDIKAQTRANFNNNIINILSIYSHSKPSNSKSQRSTIDHFSLLFRILKYKSFSDSSRLENVKINYHKLTHEQLVKKYKKLGELENESL